MKATMMTEFRQQPSQRFHQAIVDNDMQLLQWLVNNNKVDDICNKEADENGWSSLMLAARYDRREIFQYLLDLGHEQEIISTDSMGNTVPMISAKYRHEDICLMYLERYPQTMSNVNRDGSSAINWAAQNGLDRVIDWILDHGGNVNQRDIEGNTPLHHAASWNQYKTASLLLERDAQPGLKNHKGYTALEYSYSSSMDKHIRETSVRLQIKRQKRQAGSFSSSLPRSSIDIAPPTPPKATSPDRFK
ncbi:Target of rapamycin complex 2 subunit avo2 [Coemansia sp. RSA 989]|nr:ankyrin repeat-containing domain protein [Coemansia mojavensis]KAJ1739063.1 Target of rapamycin complex 2 subunit avo2 [Coemansia sp. RSA 1086]KAJ1747505.1 Target of rapamycin complex 2 subunit avo2 [Coemansia sp. RSA 1821]KAJ1861590.1 Target of rapamycin complex 2 subunit avo2 [Coemansia sp. RSA 989]KAJ1869508.1 Target of rapamycin complex 2 subunit avo2 [Coemansia sp. RSA 990]KAJ2627928.1 Target of rapamycin complex 2 subunit avo2 [Coemansia sp. RSA 1290]KAJ2646070.1 Target of rapamycin 